MKNIKLYMLTITGALLLGSCAKEDYLGPGNPTMDFGTDFSVAYFGDSLPFIINAKDVDVPLSTLKAQLFFGDEKVSETVIRTKDSDKDYEGKIYIPYLKEIPNGTATLKFILQNINFTTTEKEYNLPLSRPDFPELTLVTTDGEYIMKRTELYNYSVTKTFPQQVGGYIKADKYGENGNDIYFGWEGGEITHGIKDKITFSNSKAGKYSISFNTFNYEASPFIKLLINGNEMEMIDANNYKVDIALNQGDKITISGIPSFDEWWIDPDYAEKGSDGSLIFRPISGNYRLKADFGKKYFAFETLKNGEPAILENDGSGALWIIGDGIGKPSFSSNEIGWVTEKAICLPQIENKIYELTFVAGKQVKTDNINFKFFHQNGWGGEYTDNELTCNSDIIYVGDGENGRDKGNLGIKEGKSLTAGNIYKIKINLTAGKDKAVMTVEELGVEPEVVRNATFNGEEMNKVDDDNFKIEKEFKEGDILNFGGDIRVSDWNIDSDFFIADGDKLTFNGLDGKYRITANFTFKYFVVELMDGNNTAELKEDGSGAIWIIGGGIGKPSLGNEVGWNTDKALCMKPIGNGKHQITLLPGENINAESIDFKFFHQKGWGKEFGGSNLTSTSEIILVKESGNLEIAEGKKLDEDATYIITIDVSAGTENAILSVDSVY